jgi:hypothetical protein
MSKKLTKQDKLKLSKIADECDFIAFDKDYVNTIILNLKHRRQEIDTILDLQDYLIDELINELYGKTK